MSFIQLQAALHALYHHTDQAVKDEANTWLEQWQNSQEAWRISHDVLSDDSAGLEAHYFAAQTLRTKVQRDFEELPADAAQSLRDSLVSLVLRFAQGHTPVETQLCLAMAALATHMPSQAWGPDGVVGWLAHRLNSEPPAMALPCIMELLTVLPQEASSYQPSLRPERRRQVREEMEAATPQALSVLANCIVGASGKILEQALDALAAWLKLCGGAGLNGTALMQSPLIANALEGLRAPADGIFYSAVDAVIELIYCTSQRGRPREDMAPLVQAIVPEVMALRPRFHVCMQQALAEKEGRAPPEGLDHSDPEEEARAIARLFAEVGEAYTDLIATGAAEVMPPVEALLDVAGHPDDAICAVSFNFWHRLSRALTVGLHPQPLFSEEPALPKEEVDRRVALFSPTFERLVALVRGRVRFPEDFGDWHRDERTEFKRARVAVGDTLLDAAAVLGGAKTLQLLVAPLMELSARIAGGGQFDWRAAEAALYCVRCVHRLAPPPGDALLLSLFASLPTLPAPPQLQYTTALTVGAYADWLADAARADSSTAHLIDGLLQMMIKGLGDADSCSASALSLRRLCEGCAPLLSSSFPALLELYRRVQVCGDVSGVDGNGGNDLDLDEEDVGHVVEAVTLVASALPEQERRASVQCMTDVVVQPMQTLLRPWMEGTEASTPSAEDIARLPLILPLAERVTTIFRSTKDSVDVGEALVRLWPWLEVALNAFGSDPNAAEKICRVPRYAVRTAGKAAMPAVAALAEALPQRFETSSHSCFLYVASELVKTFGDVYEVDSSLGPMLTRMLTTACRSLGSLREVTARPDVADDTFLLAGRGLSYAPRLIMTPQLLPTLLGSAQAGILVQHREACCSIVAFLVRLLDPATHRRCQQEGLQHLQTALAPHAPRLIQLTLAGATGALPPSRLQEMSDVLYALLKVAGVAALEWVGSALALLGNEAAAAADCQRFLSVCQSVVVDEITVDDERMLLEALGELSEVCRRNHRAQTAAQHALLPPELHYLLR